ncbi:hypothetical protein Q2T46_15735 [Thermoanaerobacterium sp. CMT5567-10]|uniref:hypothetical protein n=1 Tax=Thermoanaerobacterium sp. CMT5567-10 TaxID=3061989 RepID=UPI00287FEA7E|nr:hypothetical protein [Thermoanaerobacterium sp. CMT5567-10]WLY85471.1 hypothetical protein Q2T46_15735 [Thermoanaerobacterium sp. CMT5567-10]
MIEDADEKMLHRIADNIFEINKIENIEKYIVSLEFVFQNGILILTFVITYLVTFLVIANADISLFSFNSYTIYIKECKKIINKIWL